MANNYKDKKAMGHGELCEENDLYAPMAAVMRWEGLCSHSGLS